MKRRISLLGLGTAAIGRPQYINIRATQAPPFSLDAFRKKGISLLDQAYQQGIRYFDTAPGYGLAEQLLIDWLQTKDDPTIEIATKWGYTYTANFDPSATQHEEKEHSREKLNEQWKQSSLLRPRLTTYQIHSATFETGVLENQAVIDRLAELKQKHQLLIGITTTGANQMEVLQKALTVEADGQPLFDTFQVTYNLLDQGLAPFAKALHEQGKRLIIKEALANGRIFPHSNYAHYEPLYQVLGEMAQRYEVGIDAIALGFCLATIEPYAVLSGADNPDHLISNLLANELRLAEEDLNRLRAFSIPPEQYWTERKKLSWN